MSIRPVDMQVLLPKSTEVSSQNNHRPETQQQQFTEHMNKQLEHANRSVIQTSKSDEKNNINKDGRNKDEQSSKDKKKNAPRNREKSGEKKNSSSTMFDVTI